MNLRPSQGPTRRSFLKNTALCAATSFAGRPFAKAAGTSPRETLRYQGWAGVVLFPELADDLGLLAPLKLQWVGNTTSGPQDLQATVTNNTDFAGAFNGSIMKMIGAGAPVRAVLAYAGSDARSCMGIFVRESSSIRTARDLIGKVIGVNTLRAQGECFVDQYLRRNGLTDDEIRQVVLVGISSVVAETALRHGTLEAAALPTFFRDAALAHGGLRELTTDYEFYGATNMDSVILRNDMLQNAPDLAQHFVAATAQAIAWAQNTPQADVIARYVSIIRKRGRDEGVFPARHWRSTAVVTKGGVIRPRDYTQFQPWYAWRRDTHTASLAPESIYTNRFNPFATEASLEKG